MSPLGDPHFGELIESLDRLLGAPSDEHGQKRYRDVLADLLSFLARRMTELHAARQRERDGFLAWLERQLACPVDELAGKTFIREYDRQPEGVEKLLDVIQQNHPARTSLDVSNPSAYRACNPARDWIVEGFQKSLDELRPLHRQIELSDALIDRLVYRLYDLAPEEIAIVENAISRRPREA